VHNISQSVIPCYAAQDCPEPQRPRGCVQESPNSRHPRSHGNGVARQKCAAAQTRAQGRRGKVAESRCAASVLGFCSRAFALPSSRSSKPPFVHAGPAVGGIRVGARRQETPLDSLQSDEACDQASARLLFCAVQRISPSKKSRMGPRSDGVGGRRLARRGQ
jgi:hypothetical protein